MRRMERGVITVHSGMVFNRRLAVCRGKYSSDVFTASVGTAQFSRTRRRPTACLLLGKQHPDERSGNLGCTKNGFTWAGDR